MRTELLDLDTLIIIKGYDKENWYGIHKDLSLETVSRGYAECSQEFMDGRTAAVELTWK